MLSSLITSPVNKRYSKNGQSKRKQTSNRFTGAKRPSVSQLKAINRKLSKPPHWLNYLWCFQSNLSRLTLAIVLTTVGVYAWTFSNEQRWHQGYDKLETLRKNESQLSATNEILKHELAEAAARETTGLVPATPARAIFLDFSNKPALQLKKAITTQQDQLKQEKDLSLGY